MMNNLSFMNFAFEYEDLLRDAAEAVRNGMPIEEAAREFMVNKRELEILCQEQK